jgi:hypothetical protein
MEASCEIAVEERHLSVFNWICLTFFKLLAGKALGVTGKLFPLSCLECCQTAIQEFGVFARERTDLRWQASGEEEVHHSLVLGLYCSGLLSLLETEADSSLDGVLLGADARELLGANPVLENLRLLLVGQVLRNLIVHPVLQVHVQLILEGVPPMILVRQLLHALLEVRRQEALGDVEALQLLNSIELLLSLLPRIFEGLVLLLYPLYFSLDFLGPLCLFGLAPLMITELVLPDLLELMLFFNLQGSLLDGLVEQDIENGLDLDIVIEQVIVFNLSDLVDAGLLGHVLWSRRFRLESVCLQFHFCFIWLYFALFRQEICKIDLDSCWRTWSQVVWTRRVLRLFEFHQLRFDHLNFLLLSLLFDAHLLFLSRRQFLAKNI